MRPNGTIVIISGGGLIIVVVVGGAGVANCGNGKTDGGCCVDCVVDCAVGGVSVAVRGRRVTFGTLVVP